ncbi:3939_t:CDS:2, partial [Funneliformis geosporum]
MSRNQVAELVLTQFQNYRPILKEFIEKIPDLNWKIHNFILAIIPFSIRHTGINISEALLNLLNEFNLQQKVISLTTDNKSAMIIYERLLAIQLFDAFNNLSFSHYHCTAHIINLSIQHGLELVDQH